MIFLGDLHETSTSRAFGEQDNIWLIELRSSLRPSNAGLGFVSSSFFALFAGFISDHHMGTKSTVVQFVGLSVLDHGCSRR